MNIIPAHDLDFLLRQIIINCSESPTRNKLSEKGNFARLVNSTQQEILNAFEAKISDEDKFSTEFNRIAHRQFPWQLDYSSRTFLRYYKIFSHKELAETIEEKIGMSLYHVFLLGMYFFYLFGQQFAIKLPHLSNGEFIDSSAIARFLDLFGIDFADAKDDLTKKQEVNENLFYTYSILSESPIIRVDGMALCPIPLLLYWRTTSGLYYFTVGEKGSGDAFGSAFEKYVGEVLNEVLDLKKFTVVPEFLYGKQNIKSTDWIVVDDETILFVECKTKRPTLATKSSLEFKKDFETDLNKMASFILQVYKRYEDYKNDKCPQLPYNSKLIFVPIILTLEDWYLSFTPSNLMFEITERVKELLNNSGLDASIIKTNPPQVYSIGHFENQIQLINSMGGGEYFGRIADNTLLEVSEKFEFEPLFDGEFKRYFIDPINSLKAKRP